MAGRAVLRLVPSLLSLALFVALECDPAVARPSSDHHHRAHHHSHHHAAEDSSASGERPSKVPLPPPAALPDVDHGDEDEMAINDADYYFGDDADLLTAAAGAVDAHLRAEEEASRRKAAVAAEESDGVGTVVAEGVGTSAAAVAADEEVPGNGTAAVEEGAEGSANSPANQMETRERNREIRLNTIKNTILSLLGREPGLVNANRSVPLTTPVQRHIMAQVYERMSQVPQWPPSDLYTEKVQSFYPSCEVPRNTDEEMWHGPNVMNLLFNLTFPVANDGSTISIVAAKLRLFKLSQGNSTTAAGVDGCPPSVISPSSSTTSASSMPEIAHSDSVAAELIPAADEPVVGPPASPLMGHHNPVSGLLHVTASALQQDDHRIRVSVYWYTRALKKHRAMKRKLLDSQMVSISGQEEWVEFDVRFAARVWRELGRNFGLVVEVEDEDGAVLPAERYFAAMNCSKEASTTRPFPGFLFDAAREAGGVGSGSRGGAGNGSGNKSSRGNVGTGMGGGGRALGLDTHLFPLMDLCTIQYPEGEEPLQLLPSLSSPSAFSLSFGRRPSLPSPPAAPLVMVACGGAAAGSTGQRQVVPAIHPSVSGGGRHRPHRRPDEKTPIGGGSKAPEERGSVGGKRRGQQKDDGNDATATNQLSQRREEGEEGVMEGGPVVESPSAIQVTRIRHPRRHLDSGHAHRSREGRRSSERGKEEGEEGEEEDEEEEEEEEEEVREERVSWRDEEGRQHLKRKVTVHKTVVSHREGDGGHGQGGDDGRSITVLEHHGR